MEENNQILKEQIEKLPEVLKDFVLSNKWTKKLEDCLQDFNIEEWQKTTIENEVFLILVGFEVYTNLVKNILEQAKLEENLSKQISDFVIKNILEPIAEELVKEKEEVKPTNNIGASFEEVILNQAKAMMPAQEERGTSDEIRVTNSEDKIRSTKYDKKPENLPVGESLEMDMDKKVQDSLNNKTIEPKISAPDYANGDPYREPI